MYSNEAAEHTRLELRARRLYSETHSLQTLISVLSGSDSVPEDLLHCLSESEEILGAISSGMLDELSDSRLTAVEQRFADVRVRIDHQSSLQELSQRLVAAIQVTRSRTQYLRRLTEQWERLDAEINSLEGSGACPELLHMKVTDRDQLFEVMFELLRQGPS
jgi:hypothetical protein